MVASPKTTTRKKVKKVFSRRIHSSWAGCPTDTFWKFKDYARCEIDKKEVSKTIKKYVRDNFSKDKKVMLEAPDWMFTTSYFIGATIEWQKLGHEFPARWDAKRALDRFFNELKASGNKAIASKVEEAENPAPVKKTIADIVRERTSDFICEVETIVDDFYSGTFQDIDNYSVYDELKKVDAPYNMAKAVYDYYLPIKVEAEEICKAKPNSELGEAFASWKPKRKRDHLKLMKAIVDQADRYMISKKAVRKTRVAKPKTADKQVQNMKYLKDSAEFKLTSINPTTIIGKKRIYTFNVKSRILTEYLCSSEKGFEVSGSTLQHMDDVNSRQIKLRKPEDMLPSVLKKQPNAINIEWSKLTTKQSVPNARVNKDTLILRALDK